MLTKIVRNSIILLSLGLTSCCGPSSSVYVMGRQVAGTPRKLHGPYPYAPTEKLIKNDFNYDRQTGEIGITVENILTITY